MAATSYAALVSLMQTIDHVMEHGHDSFELDHQLIQFIQEKAKFLVEFLECYSHGDNIQVEDLQTQIANVSHAAEDLIESKVVDFIHQSKTDEIKGYKFLSQILQKAIQVFTPGGRGYPSTNFLETNSSSSLWQQLHDVIKSMDLMKEEALKIEETGEVNFQLPKDSTAASSSSSTSLPVAGKDTMVGFDDVLNQTMDRLSRKQGNRVVIPISGMGGIGKTTLTRNVYKNPYIVQHFDVRAWVTISQEYEMKEILTSLLIEFKEPTEGMDESLLGVKIHKYLSGRRYLIVMDDMWSIDVWEKVQLFFPDNGNGSGIMITTRLSNLASLLGSCVLEMDFLDEEKSWDLFRVKAFGQQDCPPKLVKIGQEITKNCKGLPLSIVVIAGLLAKSNMKQGYWNHVANEVNSIISQAEDGWCSKILSLSYKNLPIHLKPCFLYMGVYPEDHEIKVSELMKLWVAEGFLKPNKTKTLEEVAEEYLTDLIDRNLIMVHGLSKMGKMKTCKIHDLLGELCSREAQREKFICIKRGKYLQDLHNHRLIVIDKSKKEQKDSDNFSNQGALSVSPTRSVTFNNRINPSLRGCKLVRVLSGEQYKLHQIASNQVNLRYLNFYPSDRLFPSSIHLLWNLHTINVRGVEETCIGPNIWKMKLLRHFSLYDYNRGSFYIPEAPPLIATTEGGQEDTILKHLQTLKGIRNLTLSQGVIERIPNIKKLKLEFGREKDYCLSNLQYLLKLESLHIQFIKGNVLGNLTFPYSLKKLALCRVRLHWDNMTIIGCLPNLQVLELWYDAFIGEEWNSIEGQFISLKNLHISVCTKLKVWNAENIHFPVLEQLNLHYISRLKEIPQGIGEIPTLRSIVLVYCNDSVVNSAMDILDEQESQGNLDIKLEVVLDKNREHNC